MQNLLWVCTTAFLAAGLNAVAGGGTFLLFPVLTGIVKMSEKAANIACTIGLWPGSASSVVAVRRELMQLPRGIVIGYTLICLAGGTAGAELLLHTSEVTFHYVIPWLLLFATLVFAMGKRIARWAGREATAAASHGHSVGWAVFVGAVQFVVSIYGGYFGAGMGVLTLAGLSLVGLGDIRQINVLKVLLSTSTNLTAAIIFLFGPVQWHYVGPMAVSATVGGFVGMLVAQRLPQGLLRAVILTIASALTAAYFWKAYG
jgi:uncharacterized membrane protein YfcA